MDSEFGLSPELDKLGRCLGIAVCLWCEWLLTLEESSMSTNRSRRPLKIRHLVGSLAVMEGVVLGAGSLSVSATSCSSLSVLVWSGAERLCVAPVS